MFLCDGGLYVSLGPVGWKIWKWLQCWIIDWGGINSADYLWSGGGADSVIFCQAQALAGSVLTILSAKIQTKLRLI